MGLRNKLKVELGSEEQPKSVARRCPISFTKLEQTTTEGALRTKPNTMININKAWCLIIAFKNSGPRVSQGILNCCSNDCGLFGIGSETLSSR